jgi:hypothetical protein
MKTWELVFVVISTLILNMNNLLKRCFANNGVARGLLYSGISILSTFATAFATWTEKPPENWYAVAAVIFASLAGAGLTLRAYIDQSISIQKNDNSKQPPV